MKFVIVIVVAIATLASQIGANELRESMLNTLTNVGISPPAAEDLDLEYLERCKKSHEYAANMKPKSAYAPRPPVYAAPAHVPAYAAPAPAYAAPAPAYAAPAPAYAVPASLSYSVSAPSIPCSKAIIVGCSPSVQPAPCSAPASY